MRNIIRYMTALRSSFIIVFVAYFCSTQLHASLKSLLVFKNQHGHTMHVLGESHDEESIVQFHELLSQSGKNIRDFSFVVELPADTSDKAVLRQASYYLGPHIFAEYDTSESKVVKGDLPRGRSVIPLSFNFEELFEEFNQKNIIEFFKEIGEINIAEARRYVTDKEIIRIFILFNKGNEILDSEKSCPINNACVAFSLLRFLKNTTSSFDPIKKIKDSLAFTTKGMDLRDAYSLKQLNVQTASTIGVFGAEHVRRFKKHLDNIGVDYKFFDDPAEFKIELLG